MLRATYVRLVVAVLLFALNPVLYRWLPLDPFTILAGVNAIAVLALATARAWRGGLRHVVSIPRAWRATVMLAVCFTINNLLFLAALQRTTVGNATLTHYLAPLFVTAIAAAYLGEAVRGRSLLALALACAGVLVMMAGERLSLDDTHMVGLLFGTASAVFFALEIVLKKVLAPSAPADVIAARYMALSVMFLVPFTDYSALRAVHGWPMAVLILAGVVTSAVAITLFTGALRIISAQHAAVVSYLEPFGAVLWALLLLREFPTRFGIAGGTLTLAGILVVLTMRVPAADLSAQVAGEVRNAR
jgi:drug/metabolite transporter (DMT)-like permease